jgi:tetratricopeptide (TPR) repeat protein
VEDLGPSGDVRQTDITGTAIAHTGTGDINVRVGDATFTVETSRSLAAQGTESSPVSVRQTLPRDIAAFTGRDDELRNLLRAVEDGAQTGRPVVVHAIDGMAGVGKSALAVHAAHQLTGNFPDGQLFVRLDAHTPGQRPVDPSDALSALLRETGMDPSQIPVTLDEKERLWRDRLAGKRILLLLDDAATHRQVRPLVPGVGGCAVLVTSRRRLAALEGAVPLPLDILPPDQAAELFARLTGRTVEPGAIAELMRLAGYLPLAIRLLAGRLLHRPKWTVIHLADELAAARDRSAAIGATDESLSAAFDLSYNRLPKKRQRFIRQLGLHPGTDIDVYAAAALTALDLKGARAEMDALFTDHLIDEPTRGRYRFHDLLGDYARALATTDPPGDQDAATDRLLDYYLHTAQIADRHLARQARTAMAPAGTPPAYIPDLSSREQAASWMETERPNLHAAVDYASLHHRIVHTIAIPAAMNGFLLTHNLWDQALILHRTALEAARHASNQNAEADALDNLGVVQRLTGDSTEATASLTHALELHRALGNQSGEADALTHLGRVQCMTDNYEAATASLTHALELHRALGNQSGEADALTHLGLAQRLTADFRSATVSQERAMGLYRALEDRNGEAIALLELAAVQYLTGDYPASVAGLSRALDLYRAIGNRNGEANALKDLGVVQCLTGDYPAATASQKCALELYRTLGSRFGEANVHYELGIVQRLIGEYPAASIKLARALDLYRTLGDRLGEANALTDLGVVQRLTGRYQAAATSLTRALHLYSTLGDRLGEAETLNNMGELSLTNSRSAEAQSRFEQALAIARAITAALEEARALEGIGQCHVHNGRPDSASTWLRQALAIYKRVGSPNDQRVISTLRNNDL